MTRITTNKVSRILINGIEPTNTKVTKLSASFNLQQTFCSCPEPVTVVKIMPGYCEYCYLPVTCHYDYCSGGEGKTKIGIYDEENKCVILEI